MEKLHADFTLKMTAELRKQFTAVAESEGMSASEYVRDLIIFDLQKRRKKYLALQAIFGDDHAFDPVGLGEIKGDSS
jgi:predicted DNA-binding protein